MKGWQVALLVAAAIAAVAFFRCEADPAAPIGDDSADLPDTAAGTGGQVRETESAELQREGIAAEPPVDPERELRGIVVDTAGNPIPGAALTAWLQVDRQIPGLSEIYRSLERRAAETVSNSDGRFSLRLEPHVVYDLVATKDRFARTRLHSLYAGEDLRVILGSAASISGRVTDAAGGAPLAGVEVMATQGTLQSYGDERLYAWTGADGEYRFENLPPNLFALRFELAGYARSYGTKLTIVEGEQARADATLDRGATLHGRVTDGATQLPIRDAEVGLRVANHTARTDADGRYLLTGVPVGYSDTVVIRAEGYGKYDFPFRDFPAAGLEQDFGLLRGRTAHGRVVDKDGVPIAAANLVAAAYKTTFDAWQMDRRSTQSAADGSFAFTDLRVDLRHTVLVAAEGHAVGIFDFPAAEWDSYEFDLGDLVLESPCTVAGVVVDTNGNPQPDLYVNLEGEPWSRDVLSPARAEGEGYMNRGGLGFDRMYAKTDARGRFAFASLPTGQYSLSAGRKGFARRANVEIELLYKGEAVTDLRLVLDAGLTIAGNVLNRDGLPIPGASVSIYRAGDYNNRITYNVTQPDGSFALVGLDAGSYVLVADADFADQHYGATAFKEVLAGERELRLTLPEALEVSGIVRGPDDQPVQDAIVQTWSSDPAQSSCNSGRDGRFTLWVSADVQAVTIVAWTPMMMNAGGQVEEDLLGKVENVAPGTNDLVIRLPKLP